MNKEIKINTEESVIYKEIIDIIKGECDKHISSTNTYKMGIYQLKLQKICLD